MNIIAKTMIAGLTAAFSLTACSGGDGGGTGPVTVESVVVRAPSDTLSLGDSTQLAVDVRDGSGNLLIGRTITWTSGNGATVSATGILRTTAPGPVTVTATVEGRSGSKVLTVSPLRWRTVAAGVTHTCAVRDDGRAYCWGGISFRVMPRPTLVVGNFRWRSVAAGRNITCGIIESGQAACMGTSFGEAMTARLMEGDPGFRVLVVGDSHFCGIGTDGRTYCSGSDGRPKLVAGDHVFTAIDAGESGTCALTAAGELFCWGKEEFGPMLRHFPLPVRVQSLVQGGSTYREHSCGLAGTETYCWGDNTSGQAGLGFFSDYNTGYTVPFSRVLVPAGVSFRSLSAGGSSASGMFISTAHTCAISTQDELYCWGDNRARQVGDGTNSGRSSPVAVAPGTKFREVSAGGSHTCAITKVGELYCWGEGGSGQLGNDRSGLDVYVSTPTLVSLL